MPSRPRTRAPKELDIEGLGEHRKGLPVAESVTQKDHEEKARQMLRGLLTKYPTA